MSVEFVEPDPAPVGGATRPPAPVPLRSAVPGRVLGAFALVAAALVVVGSGTTLYVLDRTASIVDFDRTVSVETRLPVDASGRGVEVPLPPAEGDASRDVAVTVSAPPGVDIGRWWLVGAGVLLLAAVLAVVRPRGRGAPAAVTALGAGLLGSLGAVWLATSHAANLLTQPQLAYRADPGLGFWLVLTGGALALVAGVVAAVLPRRR